MRILLIVYDNGSFIHQFPLGIGYIAAVLKQEGYSVTIYHQNQHHYPNEHLTRYLDKNRFDVIGLGFVAGYYEYRKAIKISEAIHRSKNKSFYVLGGHGPSPEPEYFLKKLHADAVVMGEGEETIKELVCAIANKSSLLHVKGIAYRDGDNIVINERRPLIANIDSLPFPAHELFPIEYYRLF